MRCVVVAVAAAAAVVVAVAAAVVVAVVFQSVACSRAVEVEKMRKNFDHALAHATQTTKLARKLEALARNFSPENSRPKVGSSRPKILARNFSLGPNF